MSENILTLNRYLF